MFNVISYIHIYVQFIHKHVVIGNILVQGDAAH